MFTTKKQGRVSGGQNGAGDVVGQDPGSTQSSLVPVELGAVVARAAAPRGFQEVLQDVWEDEDRQEVAQHINEENLVIQLVQEEEEGEEEEEDGEQEGEEEEEKVEDDDEEDEDDEDEDQEEEERDKEDEGEGEDEEYEYEEYEEEEEEYSCEEEDENYMDRKEEEDASHDSSLLDLKLGYFFHHFLVSKFLSFFNEETTEYKYENSDEKAQEAGGEEEERDRNKESEGELEMDVDLADVSLGVSSWKA